MSIINNIKNFAVKAYNKGISTLFDAQAKCEMMANDSNGAMTAQIGGLIGLLIFAVVLGAVVGPTITGINNACTTGWSTSQIAIYGVVGIVVLAVVVIGVVKML